MYIAQNSEYIELLQFWPVEMVGNIKLNTHIIQLLSSTPVLCGLPNKTHCHYHNSGSAMPCNIIPGHGTQPKQASLTAAVLDICN